MSNKKVLKVLLVIIAVYSGVYLARYLYLQYSFKNCIKMAEEEVLINGPSPTNAPTKSCWCYGYDIKFREVNRYLLKDPLPSACY